MRLTNFAGIVLTNSYDVMNRLTNRSAMGLVLAAFTYTASGERATMSDPSGTSAWQYDVRGRLVTNTTPQGTLHYRYDAAGRLTNLWSATTDGVDLVYSHDALGRITNAVEQGGSVLSAGYGFDGLGSLRTVTYGNGVTNLYQYDAMQRLTNALWKNGGTTLGSFAYALGKTGNRTNLSEAVNGVAGTFNWQYDRRYRLTNEVLTGGSSGALAYKYDLVWNRTNRTSSVSGLGNQTHSFNTNDWLTADAYDSNGNTTNSAGNTYRYDPLNRLTNAVIGGTNIVIVYDGDGNRVRKTVGSTTTLYLVDNRNPTGYAQVVEEKTVSGGVTNLSRVYALGLDLFAQRTIGGSAHYFGYDGHGSTRFLTDTSAAVTDTYRYDAYGSLIASTGSTVNHYRYTGEQWDADLGMYYLRARYLNPDTGRFWTMDSYEGSTQDPLSLHKYLYAHGNPVMMVDPSGHFTVSEINTVINGQFAVATRTITSVYRAYQKINSVVDTIQALAGIVEALRSGEIKSLVNSVASGFSAANWDFSADDVIDNFEHNSQRILAAGLNPVHPLSWSVGMAARYARGQKISALLIYMPSPKNNSRDGFVRTGVRIGKLPVILRFGGDKKASSKGGTRVLGGGVMFGSSATGGIEQQLFRMDYGGLHPGHGNPPGSNTGATEKANEIDIWDDNPFHYHVIGVTP